MHLKVEFKAQDFAMENRHEEDEVDSDVDGDALSLCDLPLTDHSTVDGIDSGSSTEHGNEFFEFFSDLSSESSSAEDIISGGKLLPYGSSPPPISNDYKSHKNSTYCRSDSSSELQRLTSTKRSAKIRSVIRNNYLLDYSKLKTDSNSTTKTVQPQMESDHVSNGKCFRKCAAPMRSMSTSTSSSPSSSTGTTTSNWRLFLFGVMKPPPQMELRDMRSRQSRRIPSPLFPVPNEDQTVSVKIIKTKSSWSLLRALGFKRHARAVATASLRCIQKL